MDWDPVVGLFGFFLVAYKALLDELSERTSEVFSMAGRQRSARGKRNLLNDWREAIKWMSRESSNSVTGTFSPDEFEAHPELGDFGQLWSDVDRIGELMKWRNDRIHAKVEISHPPAGGTEYRLVDKDGGPLAMDAGEVRAKLECAMNWREMIRDEVARFRHARRAGVELERAIGQALSGDEAEG